VPRRNSRRAVLRSLIAFLFAASSFAVGPVDQVDAATNRLPDLRAARIRDFHIQRLGSRRVLRFTGIMWNQGAGPFELRSTRSNSKSAWDLDQIVYDSAGVRHGYQTKAKMRYAGDGHDHWHVREMLTYHLWGPSGTLRDAKIGFCFFDTDLIDPDLPRSPARIVYRQSNCPSKNELSARTGLSVGWGDKYPWNFAYQWIDITSLKAGTYTIRSAVDLRGWFREESDANNCAWSKIRIGSSGTTVTVLDYGYSCINDTTGSPYAEDIAWARENGVTAGCGADMFCTNDPTTRGQAASFVARAYALPAATQDWFADDDGRSDESDIDRVAELRLISRCGVAKFCPDRLINRALVAKMIARALALPPASADYFDDDAGLAAEAYINSVAEAGFMPACGERRFCPSNSVSRGQMVRALHRSLTPPEEPAP
jgi:Lysyl oxidase/S-layer homology domain